MAFDWSSITGNQRLMQFGGDALSDLGYGLTRSPTIGGAFGQALERTGQMQPQRDAYATQQKAEAERVQQMNQTIEYVRGKGYDDLIAGVESGGMDMGAAWGEALRRGQPQAPTDLSSTTQGRADLAQQYGLTGDAMQEYVLTGKLPGGNQTARAGVGQPLFGRNKQTGAIEPWQSMTDGTMINIANPTADPSQYDFNPGIAASERAAGGGDAKTAVAARAALPAAEQAYQLTQQALATISGNQTGVDQNFGNIMGIPTQKLPAYPGSSLADMRNQVDQLSGTAFLQIRQALKGAGQVTDYEGQKGEIALNRMRAAAESGSKADFDAALVDYQTAIDSGLQLLREAAQGGYSQGAPAVGGSQPGGDVDSILQGYGL